MRGMRGHTYAERPCPIGPIPTSRPAPASRRWSARSSSGGGPSAPSRPASTSRREPGRRRVRLLRRPAVRQRPPPLRPPPHRLRQGRRPPLPDDAGPAGRAPLRLGLPRPARRDGGREGARRLGPRRHHRVRHRPLQRVLPLVGAALQPTSGTRYVTRQARWVDFDERLQDHGPRLHGVASCGRSSSSGTRACSTRAYRVLPYCWECETPLSNFETRLDDAYRQRQDPALTVLVRARRRASGSLVVDDDAVDAAVEPRPRRRARHRLRRVTRTDGDRYVLGEATVEQVRQGARGRRRGSAPSRAPSSSGAPTRRCSPTSPTRRTRSACSPATSSTTDEGTGVVHIAPGFGEDDQARLRRRPASRVVVPGRRARPLHRRGARLRRPAGLRRQPADHPRPQGRAASSCATTPTTTTTRTAGAPTRRSSTGRCRRWYVEVTAFKRPHARAQPADQLGPRARARRRVRQVARGRPRLVDQPQPLLGLADPGVEERRPRPTRASTSTAASTSSSADFGVRPDRPAPARHRRAHPAQPRRPHRPVDDAARRPTCSTAGSSRGRCRSPRCTTRSRTSDWFESHFPGDFIVEYIGQTRGWFYTLHVLSTALFDRPAFQNCVVHGVLLGDDGQKLSKRLRNYPDPDEVFETIGADAMRWSLLSSAAVRGGDMVADRRPIDEAVRQVAPADLERLVLPHALRQRRRLRGRRRADGRATCSTATSSPRRASWSTTSPPAWTPTTSPARAPRSLAFLDALNNWYIRRSRDRFWAGDQAAIDTLHTVLEVLCRVAAPLLPLLTDTIWPALTGGPSVHLADWPDRRRAARRPRAGARPWTRCARCARRRRRCARPRACASACRSPSLTVAVARRRGAAARSSTSSPTRST